MVIKCRVLLQDRILLTAFLAILLLVVIACFAPFIAPNDPMKTNISMRLQPPSSEYLLGTDYLGRCIFSRLLYGTQTSLGSALVVVISTTFISLVIGTYAGYKGGKVDYIVMRVCDVFLSFPSLIFVLGFIGIIGPGLKNLVISMILVFWVNHVRLIRGMVLSLKERNYVSIARLSDTPVYRILFRHILPSVLPQVAVLATLDVGSVILHIAGFSFLGLGIQPPTPEWGTMLNDSRQFLRSHPQMMMYPGGIIFLVVLAFNILGDRLQEQVYVQYDKRQGG
ncbi:ABC transporter permease subunit [Priestia megaterium]|nr:ABC transporter permease subunit [Priestia megaterium]